jgi:predicted transcriptional regulator
MSSQMKKYVYQKIVRKPSADVAFFEEHVSEQKKQEFLTMLNSLEKIYSINPTYQKVTTDLERSYYIEYSEQEFQEFAKLVENFTDNHMDIMNQWFEYMLTNNIYYRSTVDTIIL